MPSLRPVDAVAERGSLNGRETHTMSDPRIFFAAERTLLAWIRSGIAIMGFGFVVARFGLFLRLVAAQRADVGAGPSAFSGFSNCVGIALILLGVASMFIAALEHRSFLASLPATNGGQPGL